MGEGQSRAIRGRRVRRPVSGVAGVQMDAFAAADGRGLEIARGGMSDLLRTAVAVLAMAAVACVSPVLHATAAAQDPSTAEILERLRRLEDEQRQLREQLQQKDERLNELEQELERVKRSEPEATPVPVAAPAPTATAGAEPGELELVAPVEPTPEFLQFFGWYDANRGFLLGRTEWGELNFGAYTYVRYLNQKGLDKEYVNGLGETVPIDRRNDVQLNKVKLEFRGWLLDPKFRYVLYTWTNNPSMGQGAQVVVGGNLRYGFFDELVLGGGIFPLPSVRSNEGSWPYFLSVDHRTMADEFFRGSYTMGFFAYGELAPGLLYSSMLGNNLSILGVDAGQLDGRFATFTGALVWMPTTGEFGPRSGFGDFEDHQELATRIGAHFTFSPEDAQEQPGTDAPDNTQIRLSNGTIIFTEGALAPGVEVNDLNFYMTSFDTGMKYRGFSLEGEYYLRWLNDFRTSGPLPVDEVFDHGFQLQTSMMVWPRRVQIYGQGSYVFGEYGEPWELATGVNWWMFGRREVRFNLEYIYDRHSPIGYFAIPQVVGGTGSIFNANVEMSF